MKFFLLLLILVSLNNGLAETPEAAPEKALGNSPYKRKDWGGKWIDADGDCQNTRSEILERDNIGELQWKRGKPCHVSHGKWFDPYTGKTIEKASEMDIDHIVPLSHAHQNGGRNWSSKEKKAFANDFDNLIAVEAEINRSKGDQSPLTWRPPRKQFWCSYARKWMAIKKKYSLLIDRAEKSSLDDMLKHCSDS